MSMLCWKRRAAFGSEFSHRLDEPLLILCRERIFDDRIKIYLTIFGGGNRYLILTKIRVYESVDSRLGRNSRERRPLSAQPLGRPFTLSRETNKPRLTAGNAETRSNFAVRRERLANRHGCSPGNTLPGKRGREREREREGNRSWVRGMGRKREEDGGMVDEPTVVDRIPLNRIGWTRRFFYRDAARSIDR